MSILSQKLYIKKGSSTAACNIYSTAAEAGDKALRVGNGYVALKPITDANATAGRVSVGGVTYAIATQHTAAVSVPYTEQQWTKAGSYTFTVPDGITRVRVAVCGGGAGKGSLIGNGKNGGNTSAVGITATGGHGGGVAWEKALAVSLTAMRQLAIMLLTALRYRLTSQAAITARVVTLVARVAMIVNMSPLQQDKATL